MNTYTIINNNKEALKDILDEYYYSFIKKVLPSGVVDLQNIKKLYIFPEIKSINNAVNEVSHHTDSSNQKPVTNFNDFIRVCVNYNISNTKSSNSNLLQIDNVFNIVCIRKYIKLIDIIIDILESYKNFIDMNPAVYNNSISKLTDIQLEGLEGSASTNIGLMPLSSTQLLLKIKSFSLISNVNTNYNKISYSIANTSAEITNGTIDNNVKNIIHNLMYFLVNLSGSECRLNVLALYYYYKFVKWNVLLTCASINVLINDLKISGSFNAINVAKITVSGLSKTYEIFPSDVDNNASSITSTLTNDDIIQSYETTINFVNQDIIKTINQLYISPQEPLYMQNIINKDYSGAIDPVKNPIDTVIIAIKFLSPAENLKIIASNEQYNDNLLNNYVVLYNGAEFPIIKYYKIINNSLSPPVEEVFIEIGARFSNTTANSIEANSVNIINLQRTAITISITNFKIIKKTFISLKNDYLNSKTQLTSLKSEIENNTLRINSQSTLFNTIKVKEKMLNDQILSFNIILGAIFLVFLFIYIIDISVMTRKLLSLIFVGIILVLFVTYFIINKSYIEEGFVNKITEGFDVPNLKTFNDEQKTNYLREKLDEFSISSLSYFQKVMSVIPISESQDTIIDLQTIMNNEKTDKTYMTEVLNYKKNLGYSTTDLLKYTIYNKQVYILCILSAFLVFSLLYLLSLFVPNNYQNLIIFTALIFGIIIFSYYIIFTQKLVKTRSTNIYWGPSDASF